MRKALGLAGCAVIALAAACSDRQVEIKHTSTDDTPVRVATRLDCPEREGDLRLQSTAADGSACAYLDEDGAEVELRLAQADSLAGLEAELKALVPSEAGSAEPPEPPEPPEAPEPPGRADGVETRERTQVRLPGMRIDTEGDRASIRMPGVHIEAEGDMADVRVGGGKSEQTNVLAQDGSVLVRVSEEESAEQVRSTFLITSETPGPSGWRTAGYQARGSKPGPVVVGVLRARNERHRGLMDDVDDLLKRNVRN